MFKKKILVSIVLSMLVSAVSAFASDIIPGWYSSVVGTVSFERRATIIPLVVCKHRPCPTSKVYWSLVVQQNGVRYELAQPFAVGSTTVPEYIEILDTLINPGSKVQLDAYVEPICSDFSIMKDIQHIAILDH